MINNDYKPFQGFLCSYLLWQVSNQPTAELLRATAKKLFWSKLYWCGSNEQPLSRLDDWFGLPNGWRFSFEVLKMNWTHSVPNLTEFCMSQKNAQWHCGLWSAWKSTLLIGLVPKASTFRTNLENLVAGLPDLRNFRQNTCKATVKLEDWDLPLVSTRSIAPPKWFARRRKIFSFFRSTTRK